MMTKEEIKEGSVLIAEFMGIQKNDLLMWMMPFKDQGFVEYMDCQLLYNSSWDWIMPALKKFDSIVKKDVRNQKNFNILVDHCIDIEQRLICHEIFPTFKALVEGIKWYNTVKK